MEEVEKLYRLPSLYAREREFQFAAFDVIDPFCAVMSNENAKKTKNCERAIQKVWKTKCEKNERWRSKEPNRFKWEQQYCEHERQGRV